MPILASAERSCGVPAQSCTISLMKQTLQCILTRVLSSTRYLAEASSCCCDSGYFVTVELVRTLAE